MKVNCVPWLMQEENQVVPQPLLLSSEKSPGCLLNIPHLSSPHNDFTGIIFRRVRKVAKSYYQFRHVRPFNRPSVLQAAWQNTALTGRIFMKFDI
jgi:hypothetical protein